MIIHRNQVILLAALLTGGNCVFAQRSPAPAPRQLVAGPGRDIVQRVCGSTCHGSEIVTGKGYTKDNWGAVVNGMIARGAKASDTELTEIVDYLAKNFPPRTGQAGAGGAGFIGAGADDAHVVDSEAAERGKSVYIAECVTCHGNKARGGDNAVPEKQRGPDLVRSLVVLKDRYGSGLGSFLKQGHPMQSGKPSTSMDGASVIDLAHYLHSKVNDTLRSGPYSKPVNVLTGDATAGAAYFNGAGGCNKCHSVTGDMAGIGNRYDPVTLQQKFLFPRTFGGARGRAAATRAKEVTVTVTPAGGKAVSGVVLRLDDFNVALRDSAGDYHSWKRTAALKVEKNDPYAEHVALLDRYTDKNMHDIVAYLETLK
jgi:cytochrome c oxidase cbb3-type subunit III